jgi:hypothetical protein
MGTRSLVFLRREVDKEGKRKWGEGNGSGEDSGKGN